jgi:plastocyanin
MRRFILLAAILLTFAPFAAACNCGVGDSCHCGGVCSCAGHSTPPADEVVALAVGAPTTAHVGVDNFFFTANVTIHAGDTVQWDWIAGLHTVTSVVGSAEQFDSGLQSAGSFSHTFTQVGTFNYYCQIHGFDNGDGTADGMAATVTVLAVPEPAGASVVSVLLISGMLARRGRARRG